MARRNRVTPFGELVADPARGTLFGNRGCLHRPDGEIVRHHVVRRWITCCLAFRGRHRDVLPPGGYTGLFFRDEATALAAGHRPCAECRREDYRRYLAIAGETRADALDDRLHAERWDRSARAPAGARRRRADAGARRLHDLAFADLPDGAFVVLDGNAWRLGEGALHRWTPSRDTERRGVPRGRAQVLTPPTSLAVLAELSIT